MPPILSCVHKICKLVDDTISGVVKDPPRVNADDDGNNSKDDIVLAVINRGPSEIKNVSSEILFFFFPSNNLQPRLMIL